MTRGLAALRIAEALGQPPPTPEQEAIIEAPLESMLVVAGAGSGKTETMAARVVWLVANEMVSPEDVLGLTFTRKAAGELAARITRRLRQLAGVGLWTPGGQEVAELTPTVSTYHAYAGRLVAEHGMRVGHEPGARLLSEASCWQLAHEIVESYDGPLERACREAGRPVPATSTVTEAVLTLTGQLAEHLRDPADLARHLDAVVRAWEPLPDGATARKAFAGALDALGTLQVRRALVPLLQAYAEAKRERECLDFADQMSLAARLAAGTPDVGRGERLRHRVVLLDEFQDTSEAQLVLLRELYVGEDEIVPVMAVGDPHQSIYGWRGASATTLTSFPRHFPTTHGPARALQLSTSWRNDEAILRAANVVAAPLVAASDVEMTPLAPRPGAGAGRVVAARLDTAADEADAVASWLARRIGDPEGPGPTAAVLCRKRQQFPAVVEALHERGLPVEVVGLGGLLTMPEVADLVSFLHVVDDPTSGDHLMRILTGPLVRLAPADLAVLHEWSRTLSRAGGETDDRVGLVEALDQVPPAAWATRDGDRLSDEARGRLHDLRRRVRRVRDLRGGTVPELVAEAERALGLDLETLARVDRAAHEARSHLEALADVTVDYATSTERPTLGGLLSWLDVAETRERGLTPGQVSPAPGAVQVLTVHASKGLEWDLVAVPGLTEGTFPGHESRTRATDDGRWTVPPPRDKAWLGGLDSVPFDLRGDRAGLPSLVWRGCPDKVELSRRIDDFVAEAGAHGLHEERRLAYVAFTRARHELFLTCAVWAHQKSPRVTSRFLDEVLQAGAAETAGWAPMPDTDPVPRNPAELEPVSIAWPPGEDASAAVRRGAEEVRLAQRDGGTPSTDDDSAWTDLDAEIAVLLAERARAGRDRGGQVSLPAHLSTSALVALADDRDAFLRDLRRPMPSAPATAARRGTAFHAWIEEHYSRAAIVDLTELPGSADEEVEQPDLEAMKQHFLDSEWAARSPLEVELAVESTVAGRSLRGRIDAVFARADGGRTVVDWKTGVRPTGHRARVRDIQLAVYRLAYARLRGIDPDQVDAAFYYAASGETVRPSLPDERGLERLVSDLTDEVQPTFTDQG